MFDDLDDLLDDNPNVKTSKTTVGRQKNFIGHNTAITTTGALMKLKVISCHMCFF